MYEEMMSMVMNENVTFDQWKKFRTYFEGLPKLDLEKLSEVTDEEREEFKKKREDFAKAAHYVVSKLSLKDISKDVVLVWAYQEVQHPEKFA